MAFVRRRIYHLVLVGSLSLAPTGPLTIFAQGQPGGEGEPGDEVGMAPTMEPLAPTGPTVPPQDSPSSARNPTAISSSSIVPTLGGYSYSSILDGDADPSPEPVPIDGPPEAPADGVVSSETELGDLCDSWGGSADYSETITRVGSALVRKTASLTGCPNHVNWNINPNPAREVPSNTSIPGFPMFLANGGVTDLSEAAGAVGILFNGVSLFSSWARGTADSYENSAFYAEADTLDLCGGHATDVGWYHYHNVAGCLQEQAMVKAEASMFDHSPQLGWSYDGFPIYGQLGPDGVEMKVCGQVGAHEIHCLDLCSGYEAELEGVDGFKYRYYTSCGFDESFFPFTTNCYRGCCPDGIVCAEHVQTCGASNETAYGEGYQLEAGVSMAEPYDALLISGNDTVHVGGNQSIDCSLYAGSEAHDSTHVPTPAPFSLGWGPTASSFWSSSTTSSVPPSWAPTESPSAMPTPSWPEVDIFSTSAPSTGTVARDGDVSGAAGFPRGPTCVTAALLCFLAGFASELATAVAGFSLPVA